MKKYYILASIFIALGSSGIDAARKNDIIRTPNPTGGGKIPSFHYMTGVSASDFRNTGETTLAKTYTISSPGVYTLVQDVASECRSDATAIGAQTAIYINSSNVILDLGGRTLSHSGTDQVVNIDGIELNVDLYNVTIKNGHIGGFQGHGIIVNYGCNDIRLQNLTVSNCVGPAIYFLGTTTDTQDISDVIIDNVIVSNTFGKSTVDAVGLKIAFGWNFFVTNSIFSRNVSAADDSYGVQVTGEGRNIVFNNCDASGNEGDSAVGFGFIGADVSSACSLIGCTANNNVGEESASAGYGYGYAFTSVISDNDAGAKSAIGFYLENCTAAGNNGAASGHGFYFGNAEYFYVKNCKAFNNNALASSTATDPTDGGQGFSCYKGIGHVFEDCIANGNVTNQDTANIISAGFFCEDTEDMAFLNCEANSNCLAGHTSSTGAGFYLSDSSNVCNNTIIRNCRSYNHRATTAYGFFDADTTSSSFVADCVAFGNTTNYSISFATGSINTDAPQKVGTLANVQDIPLLNLDIGTL